MRLFDRRKTKSAATADTSKPIARVRIDSRDYSVIALDQTTLQISGYTGDLIARQRFRFAFRFELDGDEVEVPTSGVVLSAQGSQLMARYFAPQPYYQKLMRRALGAKAA